MSLTDRRLNAVYDAAFDGTADKHTAGLRAVQRAAIASYREEGDTPSFYYVFDEVFGTEKIVREMPQPKPGISIVPLYTRK